MTKEKVSKSQPHNVLRFEKLGTSDGKFAISAIQGNTRVYTIPLSMFTDDPSTLINPLQDKTGEIFIGAKRRELIDQIATAPLNPNVIGVVQPGFDPMVHGGFPGYFAYPSGFILDGENESGATNYVPMFDATEGPWHSGTLADYTNVVCPIIRNQPYPMLVFLIALAVILQPFTRKIGLMVENMILELVGPTGSLKSTLTAILAGSVWGSGRTKLGYSRTWNITINKLEQLCVEFNNCLLCLDEATANSANKRERGAAIFNFLHRLSHGTTKARMNEANSNHFSTLVLSNANNTLRSIIDEEENVAAASDVRLVTVEFPQKETGFFETIPAGFDSIEHVGKHIRTHCTSLYGSLAPAFIFEVLSWLKYDSKGFLKALETHMMRFIELARVDQGDTTEMRKAKLFALAYAAGKMAIQMNVIKQKDLGDLEDTLVKAWQGYVFQSASRDPAKMVASLLRHPSLKITEIIDGQRLVKIANDAFSGQDAYIITFKGERCLAMTPAAMTRHFGRPRDFAEALDGMGLLIANDGFTVKKRIRSNPAAESGDRFYAVRVQEWPAKYQ